jgi:hypothetical protein
MHRVHARTALAVLTGALLLVTPRADAQPSRFGGYIGSSIATISEGDEVVVTGAEAGVTQSRRVGLQLGLWLNRPLTSVFSLQPELHYTQKGVRYAADFADGGDFGFPTSADLSLNLAYLEVPVLLRADFGRTGTSVRPFIVVGPTLAYRTSCTLGVDAGLFSFSSDCDSADDEAGESVDFASIDVGGAVGAGLSMRRGAREYTATLRYTRGVRSLSPEQSGITNRNLSVLVGIGF